MGKQLRRVLSHYPLLARPTVFTVLHLQMLNWSTSDHRGGNL